MRPAAVGSPRSLRIALPEPLRVTVTRATSPGVRGGTVSAGGGPGSIGVNVAAGAAVGTAGAAAAPGVTAYPGLVGAGHPVAITPRAGAQRQRHDHDPEHDGEHAHVRDPGPAGRCARKA